MSDDPGHHDRYSRDLELIKTLVDGVVADSCNRHYETETQEHQLTSRLAQALESRLSGLTVAGLNVEVTVQELSDRGRSSREQQIGADLYVSVALKGGDKSFSKGMLVQSKWDTAVLRASDRDKLREQTDKMLRRTPESYVWVYEPRGIAVLPAAHAADSATTEDARTVGDLIADGLSCTAGDPHIGLDLSAPVTQALNGMMRELGTRRGVSFTVSQAGG